MSKRQITIRDGGQIDLPDKPEEVLEQGMNFSAALVGGMIKGGKAEAAASISRCIQGVIQGKGIEQFKKELVRYREEGKLQDDFYLDVKTLGFRAFFEVLRLIDGDEATEVKKIEVIKRMFFQIVENGVSQTRAEELYQMMRIALRLQSSDLIVLAAAYRLHETKPKECNSSYVSWLASITEECGYSVTGLVQLSEDRLVENALIGPRTHADLSGISHSDQWRLTDLGLILGEYLLEDSKAKQDEK